MVLSTALFLGILCRPALGAEAAIDWDKDPLSSLRPYLNGKAAPPSAEAFEKSDKRLQERIDDEIVEARAPQAFKPQKVPIKSKETYSPARLPGRLEPVKNELPAERDFRQLRPLIPVGPACLDGSDPPCNVETPHPAGSPPRGGYYYGYYRGEDGKLVYGKLYLPHFGEFDGQAHNNAPQRPQTGGVITPAPGFRLDQVQSKGR